MGEKEVEKVVVAMVMMMLDVVGIAGSNSSSGGGSEEGIVVNGLLVTVPVAGTHSIWNRRRHYPSTSSVNLLHFLFPWWVDLKHWQVP